MKTKSLATIALVCALFSAATPQDPTSVCAQPQTPSPRSAAATAEPGHTAGATVRLLVRVATAMLSVIEAEANPTRPRRPVVRGHGRRGGAR